MPFFRWWFKYLVIVVGVGGALVCVGHGVLIVTIAFVAGVAVLCFSITILWGGGDFR